MDVPVSGDIHLAGRDWSHVQRYLLPEILLRVDGSKSVPIYLIFTVDGIVVPALVSELDEWLSTASGGRSEDVHKALSVLESYASKPGRPANLKDAISVWKRFLSRGQ